MKYYFLSERALYRTIPTSFLSTPFWRTCVLVAFRHFNFQVLSSVIHTVKFRLSFFIEYGKHLDFLELPWFSLLFLELPCFSFAYFCVGLALTSLLLLCDSYCKIPTIRQTTCSESLEITCFRVLSLDFARKHLLFWLEINSEYSLPESSFSTFVQRNQNN